jgi:hypothetical protein
MTTLTSIETMTKNIYDFLLTIYPEDYDKTELKRLAESRATSLYIQDVRHERDMKKSEKDVE